MENKNAQRNQLVMGIAGGALLLALVVWLAFFYGGTGLQSSLLGGEQSAATGNEASYGSVTPLDQVATPFAADAVTTPDSEGMGAEPMPANRDPFSPNTKGPRNDGVTPIYPVGYQPATEQLP